MEATNFHWNLLLNLTICQFKLLFQGILYKLIGKKNIFLVFGSISLIKQWVELCIICCIKKPSRDKSLRLLREKSLGLFHAIGNFGVRRHCIVCSCAFLFSNYIEWVSLNCYDKFVGTRNRTQAIKFLYKQISIV